MILFSLNLFSGEEKLNVKPDKEGPVYIGLFGGPVFFYNKETLSVRQVWGPFAGDTFRLPSKKYRDISAALGAILGITKSWDDILLSAEISAAYNTLRYSHTQHIGLDRGTHEIKRRMGEMYSISILPGYRPVDYLRLYIKGGYSLDKFRIDNGNAHYFGPSGTHTKWLSSLLAGAAMQWMLTSHFHIRGEYSYKYYFPFSIKGNTYPPFTTNAAAGPVSGRYHIHSHNILFYLIYNL
jgi:opacity protein-like surface antigen